MSPRESNPDQLFCRFRGSGAIVQAADAARAFGRSQALEDDDQARLCIVIEELVANLFHHGGLSGDDEVELALGSVTGGIRIAIFDRGAPFNPWAASPKVGRPDCIGGAGIELVRAWTQLVGYRSSAEGNRLEILLPVYLKD